MKKNKSDNLSMFDIFCDLYPVTVDKMKNFSHNDEKLGVTCKYHKESNIFEHTRLVYEFMKCNRYDDDMLLAGILHDIGKIYTKQIIEKNGKYKIIYEGHQGYSTLVAPDIIDDFNATSELKLELDKDRIIRIINYHDDWHNNFDPLDYDYQTLQDIKDFAIADINGSIRESEIMSEEFDKIQKMDISINKNNKAKFDKLHDVELMCGVPCSGKSTYAYDNFNKSKKYEDCHIVGSDLLIQQYADEHDITYNEAFSNQSVVQKCMNQFNSNYINKLKECIIEKYSNIIVVDRTNTTKKSRKFCIDEANKFYNYNIKAKVFIAHPFRIFARNENRKGKIIPQNVIHEMIKKFRIPYYSEVGKDCELIYN